MMSKPFKTLFFATFCITMLSSGLWGMHWGYIQPSEAWGWFWLLETIFWFVLATIIFVKWKSMEL